MKKTVSKLLSLLLVLILLLALTPSALAKEEESIIDDEALDAWIKEFVRVHDLAGGGQDFSVGFCYTATGDCWYYNPDIFMYSASMYKVPVAMLLAEKEAAGEIDQNTVLQGNITLQNAEINALTYSLNPAGHAMLAFLDHDNGGKASELCMKYTNLSRDYFHQDFFDYSYYTARFITQVMQTLCEGGDERFPHVLEHLLVAQPDEYLNLRLKGRWQVAQKYGAFEERTGSYNNHVTAIVYTPTPIVVTVMTRNVGNFMPLMAEVGEYLAEYSLQLDEKLAQRQEEERLAAAMATPVPTPDSPAMVAMGGAQPEGKVPAAFGAGAQIEGGRERLMPIFYILWAAILLFGGLVVHHALALRRGETAAPAKKRAKRAPAKAGAAAGKPRPKAAPTRGADKTEVLPRGRH